MSPARGLRPAVHSSSRGISRSAVLGPLLKREAFVMKWSRYPAGMAIVKDTISSGNSQGIFAGPRSVVTGNTASNNQLLGIQFGEGSTVTGNTADNNGNTGLSGGAGAGSTIVNNTMRSNTLFGLL